MKEIWTRWMIADLQYITQVPKNRKILNDDWFAEKCGPALFLKPGVTKACEKLNVLPACTVKNNKTTKNIKTK